MDYSAHCQTLLNNLKTEGRYRTFVPIQRLQGHFPRGLWLSPQEPKEVTIWCSNDYLGMGQNPKVIQAMQDAITTYGAGTGGTRNISGTTGLHEDLEASLAQLHGKESALVLTSGYVANETTLTTLGKIFPNCVYLSDANNHASIIHGIRHSGCEKHIFRHNDAHHLNEILTGLEKDRPKIVVFESVYSMDGDIAPLQQLIQVAQSHKALTYLDEVHGVGMYGPQGGGIAQAQGFEKEIDIIQGTLGKAFGLMGGYIAAKAPIIDAIRSFAPGFIFTTSLPPGILGGALASVKHLKTSQTERHHHQEMVALLKHQLEKKGIPLMKNSSHIIPILIPGADACKAVAHTLLETHSIYAQPINYPTVPRGLERLRMTPSALHTKEHIDHLTQALGEIWQRFSLPKAA